jgi:hypothetical protein
MDNRSPAMITAGAAIVRRWTTGKRERIYDFQIHGQAMPAAGLRALRPGTDHSGMRTVFQQLALAMQ